MIRPLSLLSLGGLVLLCACGGSTPRADSETSLKTLKPDEQRSLRADLIETMVEEGAYDSAVPLLRQAMLEERNSPQLHYLLATVLRERGRLEQSVLEFQTALRLNPTYAKAHGGLGMSHNLLGQHKQATVAHQSAVKYGRGDAQLANNLGFSLYLESKFKAAVEAYENAIRIDPNLRVAYVNLGFALAAQGLKAKAERAFSQVLQPAEVVNNLAIAEELRGNPEAAKQLYGQALTMKPGFKDALSNLSAAQKDKIEPPTESEEKTP